MRVCILKKWDMSETRIASEGYRLSRQRRLRRTHKPNDLSRWGLARKSVLRPRNRACGKAVGARNNLSRRATRERDRGKCSAVGAFGGLYEGMPEWSCKTRDELKGPRPFPFAGRRRRSGWGAQRRKVLGLDALFYFLFFFGPFGRLSSRRAPWRGQWRAACRGGERRPAQKRRPGFWRQSPSPRPRNPRQ